MLAIQTVLHPTDFSESSDYAFRLARSLARDYGARLILLHVAPVPTVVYGEGIVPPQPEENLAVLRARLQQLKPRDPKTLVEHRLIEGDAATEIVQTAVETGCDVIVMGTHGRTGLPRFLMGSVAEQVVRRAPCPVVAVKTPLPKARPSRESGRERASEIAGVGKE
jgi:nucleotide-binding universal stress UspA family protein